MDLKPFLFHVCYRFHLHLNAALPLRHSYSLSCTLLPSVSHSICPSLSLDLDPRLKPLQLPFWHLSRGNVTWTRCSRFISALYRYSSPLKLSLSLTPSVRSHNELAFFVERIRRIHNQWQWLGQRTEEFNKSNARLKSNPSPIGVEPSPERRRSTRTLCVGMPQIYLCSSCIYVCICNCSSIYSCRCSSSCICSSVSVSVSVSKAFNRSWHNSLRVAQTCFEPY